MPGPQPQVGAPGEVVVLGYPMRLLVDDNGDIVQYEENDPERFGDKLSIGDLKYGDFNPYENAFSVGQFDGGYGLQRYADLNDENLGIGALKESTGIDSRFGPAFLAGLVTTETLPSSAATPVWVGEFTPSSGAITGAHWVAVAGTKIYYRQSNGVWIDTGYALASAAVQGAIVVVGGQLIIGEGAAHTAQYVPGLDGVGIGDVQDTGANKLFVFAATTDRAAIYIAGGVAATNTTNVLSAVVTAANPAQSFGLAASAFTCGATDSPITALTPGGLTTFGGNGQALVFVGKTKELGAIAEVTVAGGSTPVAIYFTLLPFDSSLSTNCQGMKLWQGTSEDQRGPEVLVFGRDRSPWTYAPAAASAKNIAAWAQHGRRPPTIRGRPTCFQGTARWLYYGITRGDGHSYVLCFDSATQSSGTLTQGPLTTSTALSPPTNVLFDLGVNACSAMGITSLFGTNPLLFFGRGNNIAQVMLPLDGENPLDDANISFGSSGTMTMPDADWNFPDEDKVAFVVRMVHDQVAPGGQDISVQVSLDGGAFTTLGSAQAGNSTSVTFATSTVVKRVTPRFVLTTTDPTKTPILLAFTMRASINNVLYREWVLTCEPVAGSLPWGGEDRQNVKAMLDGFWAARRSGIPFAFVDVWQDNFVARLLRFNCHHRRHSQMGTPEVVFQIHLLEVSVGAGNSVYGNALATYGASTSKYA
jgi:hypothetical protein